MRALERGSCRTKLWPCAVESKDARVETVGAKPVILIVEDEAMIRMGAIGMIEDLGYAFFEASNADEAISILEQRPEITVVFTDIQMAGSMNGLELSAYVRNRWPPVKFIIVSGNYLAVASEMPEHSKFIRKPYRDVDICEAIRAFS